MQGNLGNLIFCWNTATLITAENCGRKGDIPQKQDSHLTSEEFKGVKYNKVLLFNLYNYLFIKTS